MKKIRLLAGLLLASLALAVQAADYVEGRHYKRITPPQPTSAPPGKVEVVELFWYGCPHCYRLEPYVKRWLKRKPANVVFVRLPGIFRPSWELGARAYFTAEILGVLDEIHPALFDAIHAQRRRLNDEAAMMAFFKEHGVSEADFKRTFHSFAVETRVRRARDMSERYQARGVPTLIVNGKYRTSAREAGSNAKIFKVVDYLVRKESQGG